MPAILQFGLSYSTYSVYLAENSSKTFTVTLSNTGETAITGLTSSIESTSGSNVNLSLQSAIPSALPAGAQTTLAFKVVAESGATATANFVFRLTDGNGFARTMSVPVTVQANAPIAGIAPQSVTAGLVSGDISTYTFTLSNTGYTSWANVRLGTPTLNWVSVVGENSLGDIAPGASKSFMLRLSPTFDGLYGETALLEVYSDNAATVTVSGSFTVSSSRTGNVRGFITGSWNAALVDSLIPVHLKAWCIVMAITCL